MATEIDIVNLALSRLGEASITSLTEDSTVARLAQLSFGPARDSVLRDHLWNFAMTRASLPADAVPPVWGFGYAYTLPIDCLRVIQLNNTGKYPFQIEGRKVVTDLGPPLQILYVRQVTEIETFDAQFVDTLATYLASEWAERITGSTTLREQLHQIYSLKLQEARSMDGQEGPPGVLDASLWINSRF